MTVTTAWTWAEHGLVVHRGLLPDDLIDNYVTVRGHEPTVWPYPTPYMDVAEIRDLCCYRPVQEAIETVMGEPPLLHLNLTNFRSTQRLWHQDGYLNPEAVGDYYAAVWMALDDIHPDAGPFEFVPGSHLWPGRLTRADALALGTAAQRGHPDWLHAWPTWTQDQVGAHWDRAIADHDAPVEQFDARRGDVLIWSPWLVHRGSKPRDPTIERAALISHYSGIGHRADMVDRAVHRTGTAGGAYAVINR